MQYLKFRQSSVKREGKLGKLLYSFLKYFSFFVLDFFSLRAFEQFLAILPQKAFFSLRRFKFFGAYIRGIFAEILKLSASCSQLKHNIVTALQMTTTQHIHIFVELASTCLTYPNGLNGRNASEFQDVFRSKRKTLWLDLDT